MDDVSGAVTPNAYVEILGANFAKHLRTDGFGKLPVDLPIGSYDLTAIQLGFKAAKKRVNVQDTKNQLVTFVLELAPSGPVGIVMGGRIGEPTYANLPDELGDESEKVLNNIAVGGPDSKLVCTEIKKDGSDAAPADEPRCVDQSAKYGTPFSVDGKFLGVSANPGKPTYLYLWVDNQSDETEFHYFCCGKIFWDQVVAVYDAQGNRMPSKVEQAAQAGNALLESCTCSGDRPVPPHRLMLVDSGDLLEDFQLAPGRYVILFAKPSATAADLHTGLQITVPSSMEPTN